MADQAGSSGHSALCLRLMQLSPRVTRRGECGAGRTAPCPCPLRWARGTSPHQSRLRRGPLTVGKLAARLDLTLPTVSGVLADLDRAGLVERQPDPASTPGRNGAAPTMASGPS